jgi:curved DNA-binding protein CbpA
LVAALKMVGGKALERNHNDIFSDKRLLSRFLKQVYTAYDSPTLIKLAAQDGKYPELCRIISNANQKNSPKLFQSLDNECQKQGFDLYTIQLKLKPVSTALGLVKSSGEQVDYYDLLKVEANADVADIRKAYRELARKTHPDAGKNGDGKAFVELNEAYQTLIDPDLRYYYDQSRQNQDLWNEQSGSPQKQKKRLRNLYQIGLILILFVFAAYLSDMIFHQKAITDDPYSERVNDEAKLKGKNVIQDEKNEFKDGQKALVDEPNPAVPSGKDRGQGFSRANSIKNKAVKEKTISNQAVTRNYAQRKGGKDNKTSEASGSNISQERPLKPVNFTEVASSGAHSERLSREDVHVIIKGTHVLTGISKDIPEFFPSPRRVDTASRVTSTEKSAESRANQLKRLAKLKEVERNKQLDAKFTNEVTKKKTAHGLGSKSPTMEDIQAISKDTHLSADIKDHTTEVLLAIGQPDNSIEPSRMEGQEMLTESQVKRLASLKAPEEKQQLNSRLNAFLRSYCREYENKDIEKFSKFFAPDAIEKGKPFTKLIYKYKKNFKTIKDIKYAIRIGSYSKEATTDSIFLTGNFSLNWRMNDSPYNESTGDIYFTLHENGDSFLVKRLDYTFKR